MSTAQEVEQLHDLLYKADAIIESKTRLRVILQKLSEVLETANDDRISDEFLGNVFRTKFGCR